MLPLQADGVLTRDLTGAPRWIDEPECYTHASTVEQRYPGPRRAQLHNAVSTYYFVISLSLCVRQRTIRHDLHVLQPNKSP